MPHGNALKTGHSGQKFTNFGDPIYFVRAKQMQAPLAPLGDVRGVSVA